MSRLSHKRYVERKRKEGLCISCNEPAEKNRDLCKGHLEKRKMRQKKRRKNKKFKYQRGGNYV